MPVPLVQFVSKHENAIDLETWIKLVTTIVTAAIVPAIMLLKWHACSEKRQRKCASNLMYKL